VGLCSADGNVTYRGSNVAARAPYPNPDYRSGVSNPCALDDAEVGTALLWSALAVGVLGLIEPKVWGNGDSALLEILQNKTMLLGIVSVLACRLVATTFCVGTGTVGGVFTPTLFAGAALGLATGRLLHSPEPSILAICGMGLLMAAVTHAPFMAALMAVELTGQWHLLPIILPCNLLASFIARTISRESLYAIASPEPAQ
jgi:CIC family chloride channel protein